MDELTKEELIQTPKKKHRWIFTIYSVLCILSIANCAVYVSPQSVYLCIMLCIYWILFLIYRKTRLTFGAFFAIGIALYLFLGFYLNIITYDSVTYRHPWQYEKEMARYRQYERTVSYFPETIPDCATDVSLQIYVGVWQAKSYITLSFMADDAYIQKCKEKHMPLFFEYNGYNSEGLSDYVIEDWKNSVCIDLYPTYEKEYNRHFTPDYMEAFSVSKEEAVEQAMGWILPRGVHLTEEELRSAKEYMIGTSGQGFIIVEDTNRIIFYKDDEH